ncbi:MAG: hypothetical protein QW705_01765 [Zestosphaera sp.]
MVLRIVVYRPSRYCVAPHCLRTRSLRFWRRSRGGASVLRW